MQIALNVPDGQYPRTLVAGDVVKVLYTPRGNNGQNSGRPTSAAAAATPRPVPHAPTLITSAFVTSVDASAAGQNAVVVGIEVRNARPRRGRRPTACRRWRRPTRQAAITVARLDPGHEYDKGDG